MLEFMSDHAFTLVVGGFLFVFLYASYLVQKKMQKRYKTDYQEYLNQTLETQKELNKTLERVAVALEDKNSSS